MRGDEDGTSRPQFEFIKNSELSRPGVTFYDAAGTVRAKQEAVTSGSEASHLYRVVLNDLRSVSLIHRVVIGSPSS